MTFKKLLLLILVFLLTLSFAHAQINVNFEQVNQFFVGASDARPTICSCGTFFDEITIRNNARFASSYEFESNSEFVTLPNPIILRPGEEITLNLVISIPCNQRPSFEDYQLRIYDSFGNTQRLSRTIEIQKCASIDFNVQSVNQTTPCTPVEFNVNLTNIAPFAEEYVLRALNYNQYFTNDTFYFSLAPGQKGIASLTLTPACELFGEKQIEFELESLRNKVTAKSTFNLEIERAYYYSLETNAQVTMCVEDGLTQNVVIRNEVPIPNTYDLSLQRARGIASIESPLSVKGNAQNQSLLTLNPSNPGLYEFTLISTSRLGGLDWTQDISLEALKCYDFSLNLISSTNYCAGQKNITVLLENKGLFEEQFQLTATLYEDMFFNQTITLDANDSRYVQIPIFFEDSSATLPVQINAYSNGISKTINANINVKDSYACTFPSVENLRVFRYFEEEFSLNIKNTGFKSANYTLAYTNMVSGPQNLYLGPGESKAINLTHGFNKSFIGINYFNLTLSTEDFSYENQITLFVRGDTYTQIFIDFLYYNWLILLLILLILLILLLLVLFIIRWVSSKFEYKKPGMLRTTLLILALLFLLFVLMFSVQDPLNPKTGEFVSGDNPLIIINSNYDIDLSNYFVDPDGGVLTYSVVEVPEIDYLLFGNILTLYPENFKGNTSMVISATDEAGETTISPSFLIKVYEKQNITFNILFERYSLLIYALIFLLISVLIYLTPLRRKVKNKSKK